MSKIFPFPALQRYACMLRPPSLVYLVFDRARLRKKICKGLLHSAPAHHSQVHRNHWVDYLQHTHITPKCKEPPSSTPEWKKRCCMPAVIRHIAGSNKSLISVPAGCKAPPACQNTNLHHSEPAVLKTTRDHWACTRGESHDVACRKRENCYHQTARLDVAGRQRENEMICELHVKDK